MAEYRETLLNMVRGHWEWTPRQQAVLIAVGDAGEAGILSQDVARVLEVNKPSVSRAADKMQEAGYLRRRRSTEDVRLVYYTLTERGAAMYDRLLSGFGPAANKRRKAA